MRTPRLLVLHRVRLVLSTPLSSRALVDLVALARGWRRIAPANDAAPAEAARDR
jgi:hypothetical protein